MELLVLLEIGRLLEIGPLAMAVCYCDHESSAMKSVNQMPLNGVKHAC